MADIDPKSITASCPSFTEGGKTGERCVINVKGLPKKFLDDLKFSCSGPAKSDVLISDEAKEDDIEVFFVPIVSGEYKVNITYRRQKISGSPFKIKVTGDALDVPKILSKVLVHGRAHELGKAYSLNEFLVDVRELHPIIGGLSVHMKGPERSSACLNIKDLKNGTFKVSYKPTSPGIYTLDIKIGETHIPGSPFAVRVTEFLSS